MISQISRYNWSRPPLANLQIFETIISIGRRHSLIIHGDISNSRPAKSLEILPVQILNRQTIAELTNDLHHPIVKTTSFHTLGSKNTLKHLLKWPSLACYTFWKAYQPCPNPQQKWIQHTATILPPKFAQNIVKNYWFQRLTTFLSVGLEDPLWPSHTSLPIGVQLFCFCL